MKPYRFGLFSTIFICIVLSLPVFTAQAYVPAQAAYDQGTQASIKGDWKSAISKFDLALQLNPSYEDAYYYRGIAKISVGDYDGCIADFTQVLSFNPVQHDMYTVMAYGLRASAKYDKGDLDGAMADYDQAIALSPRAGNANLYRGMIKFERGDMDAALEDFNQSISSEVSQSNIAYKMRAYVEYEKMSAQTDDSADETKALQDMQKSVELDPQIADYQQLFIWLIRAKKPDQVDDASRDLIQYVNLRPGKPDDWPLPVAHYLAHDSSEDALLQAANSGDKQRLLLHLCDAYFYIGMKHSYDGDAAGATSYFQKCVDTKQIKRIEYMVAQARLKQANPSTDNEGQTQPQ